MKVKFVNKTFTFFVCMLLLLCCLTSCEVSEQPVRSWTAKSSYIYMDARQKEAFADSMDTRYASLLDAEKKNSITSEDMDKLLAKTLFVSEDALGAVLRELETYGVYRMEVTSKPVDGGTTYVMDMSMPSIFYDAPNQQWIVICGGKWKDESWKEEIVPGNKELGTIERFGLLFEDHNDNYNATVTRTFSCLADQKWENVISSTCRSDGPGGIAGCSFELHESVEPVGLYDYTLIGHYWYCTCTYDACFETFSAYVCGYYVHNRSFDD